MFKNARETEEEYFSEFEVFKERKLEQQDRIKVFYVLEQMFEQTRSEDDKLSEAQGAIKDYFSNPENTHFFDKNKIT